MATFIRRISSPKPMIDAKYNYLPEINSEYGENRCENDHQKYRDVLTNRR